MLFQWKYCNRSFGCLSISSIIKTQIKFNNVLEVNYIVFQLSNVHSNDIQKVLTNCNPSLLQQLHFYFTHIASASLEWWVSPK